MRRLVPGESKPRAAARLAAPVELENSELHVQYITERRKEAITEK